jgi:Cu(I)/Ag(I) efflux system membrane fusion protein
MLEKHYGHAAGQSHYLAYCPMAFENAGAYWLQTDRAISNPYFGARMLRCGEIRDSIP